MEIENQKEITNEELQIYDRQRFIGVEVQRRLLNARIFITPINGINTELAKNLILCGTNICISDNQIINQDDVETNFLISPNDIGKNRGQVIKQKLNDMNPMVQIDLYDTFNVRNFYQQHIDQQNNQQQCKNQADPFSALFFDQFNIIISSTSSFKEMVLLFIIDNNGIYFNLQGLYDQISKKLNKPYYNLLCCGLYGFFYVSLGSNYECIVQKPSVQKMQFINGKLVKEDEQYQYFHKIQIKQETIFESLNTSLKNPKPVLNAIKMMYQSQIKNLIYDAYNESYENQKVLEQIIETQKEIIKNQNERNFFEKFAKFYSIEHCPVYSVIGSVCSQEIIKVISKDKIPAINWFVYDSQVGYGKIENTQQKKEGMINYIDLPELSKRINNEL
ncbi:hypothetical protein IMG5_094990 [Ichthyophthirius multifiliis]|uniref:THIF-type NAD/FAD binding fold domain-containing protein n=1 Tax=Ichthyophthirius multifiliis TaxID=5932 RepID=G0QRL3_ICHMU|nr:hypothetical protein IMG5_094990 [Ichthyophthirius multifiliis]EGR32134.1 hypothetical protein IMG5_094990 [Ichthyophthirius multifiliis]|eukprot:XP_004035620.1 hypothetical protein IMG5_094990 [Ichthyophthirius multifiliis]